MRPLIPALLPQAAVLMAVSCNPEFKSEDETWSFIDGSLTVSGPKGFTNEGEAILPGTPICPAPKYEGDDGPDDTGLLWDCFEHDMQGGSVDEDHHCVTPDTPGEAVWSFSPSSCPPIDAGWQPTADRVVFQVADLTTISALLDQWSERYAIENCSTNADRSLDDSLLTPEGEPFRIAAGATVMLYVALRDDESGLAVAWEAMAGAVSVEATAGEVETETVDSAGFINVRLTEGAEAWVHLDVDGQRWTAASPLLGVSTDDAVSLQLLPVYGQAWWAYTHTVAPLAARAVLRDPSDNLVYGAPVTWAVRDGRLVVEPGPLLDQGSRLYLAGADYAFLADECIKPSKRVGPREVVLQASYGTLSDEVTLAWDAYDPDQISDEDRQSMRNDNRGWEPDERCMGTGCSGCSGSPSGHALWPLGLAGLALGQRRRQRLAAAPVTRP